MLLKSTSKYILLILIMGLGFQNLNGQFSLSGKVIGSDSNEGLPFATIYLTSGNAATTSDESGNFTLTYSTQGGDSLRFSFIGYTSQTVLVDELKNPLIVTLSPNVVALDEVIIRPWSPEEMIKRVKRNMAGNHADHAFNMYSKYEEQVTEDGNVIDNQSAMFKSWVSGFTHEPDQQHQAYLYHRDETVGLEFMKEKAEKKKAKYLKKNPEEAEKFEDGQLFLTNFGGPEAILQLSIASDNRDILDTTQLNKFELKYGPETTYEGRPVIRIDYETKGKIDDKRFSGHMLIDGADFAVLSIEESGNIILPIAIRPILFALGIGLKSPSYRLHMKTSRIDGSWFPEVSEWDILLNVTKKKMFKENERARFQIDQSIRAVELVTEDVRYIPEANRFNSEDPLDKQIHPIEGKSWPQ